MANHHSLRPSVVSRRKRIAVHVIQRPDTHTFQARYWLDGKECRQGLGADYESAIAAADKLQAYLNSHTGQQNGNRPACRLKDLIEKYRTLRSSQLKRSTREANHRKLDAFLAWLGNRELRQITLERVEEFLIDLEHNVSKGTVNNYMMVLKRLFNCAKKWNMMRDNPVDGIPPRKVQRKTTLALSGDEVRRLLHAAAPTHFHVFVALSIYAGTRKGETQALGWEHVHFSSPGQPGYLTVETSIEEDSTKNFKPRHVPLNPELEQILLPLRKNSGYICRNGQGGQIRNNINRDVYLLYRKAGIGAGVTVHSLRHTFAKLILAAGYSLAKLQHWMGHQNPQTTMIYAHWEKGGEDLSRVKILGI